MPLLGVMSLPAGRFSLNALPAGFLIGQQALLKIYDAAVQSLVTPGWLTAGQAATLASLYAALWFQLHVQCRCATLCVLRRGRGAATAWNTWDRLRACGAGPLEMLAGKAVPALAFLVAQQVVVMSVGVLGLGLHVGNPSLLAVAVLGWVVTLLCLGTALGTFARNLGELSAIQDVGGLVLTGLGGALVPLAVLPAWVHQVAEFSPGYWGVQSMRWALDGNARCVFFAEFVLGCFAIAAIAAAAWRIRRGWQRGQVM